MSSYFEKKNLVFIRSFLNQKSSIYLIVGIIFVAFILRLYGINTGLPYLPLHVDEEKMVQGAMEIGEGLNPRALGWPGTLYMFILSLLYAIYFAFSNVGALLSHFTQKDLVGLIGVIEDFYISFYRDASIWYLIGRSATVLFGTATIYIAYLCGRKLYGVNTGIIASLLLTFMQLHIAFSKYALADVPMSFFVMLAFLHCYYIYKDGKTKHYIIAGLISGFAIATKFNAGIIIVTIYTAHLLSQNRNPLKLKNALPDRNLLFAYCFLTLGFYIGCPYIAVQLPTVLKEMTFSTIGPRIGSKFIIQGIRIVPALLWNRMGSTILIFSIAGIIYSLWKHTREDVLLLSFPLVYLFSLFNSSNFYPRYVIPALPFLAILGARALVYATGKIPLKKHLQTAVFWVIVSLVMTVPFVKVLVYERSFSKQDTRLIAKEWIELNIPSGTKIALRESLVPLVKSKATLQRDLSKLLDTETAIRKKYEISRGSDASYPYEVFTNLFLNDEQSFIKQHKYALRDPEYPRMNYDIVNFSPHPMSLLVESYEDLMEKVRKKGFFDILISDIAIEELGMPIKTFTPSNTLSGPSIKIYKLNPEPNPS